MKYLLLLLIAASVSAHDTEQHMSTESFYTIVYDGEVKVRRSTLTMAINAGLKLNNECEIAKECSINKTCSCDMTLKTPDIKISTKASTASSSSVRSASSTPALLSKMMTLSAPAPTARENGDPLLRSEIQDWHLLINTTLLVIPAQENDPLKYDVPFPIYIADIATIAVRDTNGEFSNFSFVSIQF